MDRALRRELRESIVETLEILSDEDMMLAIRESIKDVEAGRVFTMEEIEREFLHDADDRS